MRALACSIYVALVLTFLRPLPAYSADYPTPEFDFSGVGYPNRVLLNPVDGIRPLHTLVIFIRLDGFDYTGKDAASIRTQVFGPASDSFARFLGFWSNGSVFMIPAAETNSAFSGSVNDGIVIVNGGDAGTRNLSGPEWRRLGLDLADPFVDFSVYDHNGDGRVDNRELSILIIQGDDELTSGQVGPIDESGRELDGVDFEGRTLALAGDGSNQSTRIHEFMHQAFDHVDLYGFGIGRWDIMGKTGSPVGVSSFTKLLLGWSNATIVTRDGWYTLRRSDQNEDMLLLYNPDHGTHEYFLVENRVDNGTNVLSAPDSGLYIQRVNSRYWGSRHSSEPPVETIRPDGMRLVPTGSEFSVLANDAAVGDSEIEVVHNYFDSIPVSFDAILNRDGESDREEIVTVESIVDNILTLDEPLALAHERGTEIRWAQGGFENYFATELAHDASRGTLTISIRRLEGNVPPTPFDADLGGSRVTINSISDSVWTLSGSLGRDFPAGTSLRSLWSPTFNDSSNSDAWDIQDADTMDFGSFEGSWGDGTDADINIFNIGRAAETTDIYVDVPADEVAFYLERPKLHRMTVSFTGQVQPWVAVNTGSSDDSIRLEVTDRSSRVWATVDAPLPVGVPVDLDPLLTSRNMIPDGLEVQYRANSVADPTVVQTGTILVDWPFSPFDTDSSQIVQWSGTRPDQRVFALVGTGGGVTRSTAANFRGSDFNPTLIRTISPRSDVDAIFVTLPDLQRELLPLLELPDGVSAPVSVPDCGPLGSLELPGPFGPETIELRSMLQVQVVPRHNHYPRYDTLKLASEAPGLARHLRRSFDCPFLRVTDPPTDDEPPPPPPRRVSLQLGAPIGRSQRYQYDVEVLYQVQILRVPAASIYRDLAEEDGRGIACPGGFFPICEADAFGRFETPLPTPRLRPPGCPADGCPDHFVFSWQGRDALELVFLAPPATSIFVLDAFGKRLAEAFPTKPLDTIPTPMANVAMAPTATGENAVGISNPSDILAMNSQPLAFSDEPPPAPPSPFELDEVIPERVSYQLSMANASQGLHFLQIHLPPEHDAESDPNPVTVSWEPTDPDGDGLDGSIDNCPSAFNPDQTDFDADGGGDSCDNDVDGDNVANEFDICPQTTVGSVVDPTNGCSIAQLCPCAGPLDSGLSWKNHGAYVSCVAKTSNAFVRAGLIFGKEKDELVSEAGQSSCGSKN